MTRTRVPPVLVTGATGRIGRAVVDLLMDAGLPVRALTHRSEAAATLPGCVEVVTGDLTVPGSAWIISQWWAKGGTFAFAGWPPESLLNQFCPAGPPGRVGPGGKQKAVGLAECLTQHGYTQWTRYQPAGRFWAFQWIEGGWLLALAVLLIAATVWLVHRRPT
jgi:hypothetical protein